MDTDKSLLRFFTGGSVNAGKSTLVSRMMHDAELIPDDHLTTSVVDGSRHGTTSHDLDSSLLATGLRGESDGADAVGVVHRHFRIAGRKFIAADTSGHDQHTRHVVTAAVDSDLAVILVDAAEGILAQTRRHVAIVSLMGLRHVVYVVNKMDVVGFDQNRFSEIAAELTTLAERHGVAHAVVIPAVARDGDNLVRPSARIPWYRGPTLLDHLEAVEIGGGLVGSMRLPVQCVKHLDEESCGLCGTLASGSVGPGDAVRVLPPARQTTVRSVLIGDREVERATKGDAVTLVLNDGIDISCGDVVAAQDTDLRVADQFAAHVVWMADQPLLPGRPYLLKIAAQTVSATISTIKHKVSVDTAERVAARKLELNDIAYCNLSLSQPIVFEPFKSCQVLGSFVLIDKVSDATVGAGFIDFELRRATNIHWQALDNTKATRAAMKAQKACCLWFTGLSASGKSTIANLIDKRLAAFGHHTYVLDGDNVRHGLNRDLGFTDADRVENIRRVAEVAHLMVDAGLIVIVSFISPFRSERRLARELFQDGEFIEVFIDTPLGVCEARDPKGLYRKARAGILKNFTGIDSAYEAPESPEIRLDGAKVSAEDLAQELIDELRSRDVL